MNQYSSISEQSNQVPQIPVRVGGGGPGTPGKGDDGISFTQTAFVIFIGNLKVSHESRK